MCGGDPVRQNVVSCDRDQQLVLPASVREWRPEDQLAWCVLEAVEPMDRSACDADYRDDGWGRAAHDPAMMLALVLDAEAIGERASPRRERRCSQGHRVSGELRHSRPVIMRRSRAPRARHSHALASVFTDVLVLCATAGLVSVGRVGVDGSLIAGNASPGATTSDAAIRQDLEQMLEQAAHDTERFGPARGDELPRAY
jgi:hypothetical protein